MISKLLVWIIVSSGLLVAMWLAVSAYYVASLVMPLRYQRPELRLSPFSDTSLADPHLHDSEYWVNLGPFEIRIYPRRWATWLIALGILLIVAGLFAVLHVPNSHSRVD